MTSVTGLLTTQISPNSSVVSKSIPVENYPRRNFFIAALNLCLLLITLYLVLVKDVQALNSNIEGSTALKKVFLQFDIKVIRQPRADNFQWLFKVESFQKQQVVELPLVSDLQYQKPPVVDEWRTYRFDFQQMAKHFPGLDLYTIDKIMVFPTWGAAKDALYRIDNVFIGHEDLPVRVTIFDDKPLENWPLWDCCGRSTPKLVVDEDRSRGSVVEFFVKNENRGTVLGFNTQAAPQPSPFNIDRLIKQNLRDLAQLVSPDVSGLINFNLIDAENINSIGAVYAIVKDNDGFMWFGGSDGLARYDGYQLKIFRHDRDDANSLSNNTVWDLLIDKKGSLWVATDFGLNLFNPHSQNFTRFTHQSDDEASLSNNIVKVIFQDSRQNIWVGTYGGLNLLNTDGKSFQRFISEPNNPQSISDDIVNEIIEDSDGMLWIATNRGLNRYDAVEDNFHAWFNHWGDPTSLENERTRSVYEDKKGRLWIGTYTGLNLLDKHTGLVTRYRFKGLDKIDIGKITMGPLGNLWLTTGDALLVLNPENNTFSKHQNEPGRDSSFVGKFPTSIYLDESDNWWLGTFPDGINYVERNKNLFTTFQHDPEKIDGLSNDSVLTIEEDRSGNLWLGTDGGTIDYLQRTNHQFINPIPDSNEYDSLAGKGVLSATLDANANLWIGLWEESPRLFDPVNKTFLHQTPQRNGMDMPASLIVWTSLKDSKGNMWFGTINDALIQYNVSTQDYLYFQPREDSADSFGSLFVWSIFEDSKGQMWFGTNNGVEKYLENGNQFLTYTSDPSDPYSISSDIILAINEDHDGNLWFGTRGGGLNKLDVKTERFTSFTTKDGLPDNVVTGILTDDRGFLWLSTYNGLCRFDIDTKQCLNFNQIGGLKTIKFNIGAAKKLSTGELAFGSTGGFAIFDPLVIRANKSVPPVVLTDFQIANQSVQPGAQHSPILADITQTQEIVLDHTQSMFSFEFAALDYQNSDKNQYAYMLEGYDESWNEIGNRRRATYTNLNPGDYVFRAKGSNSEGVWNHEGVAVSLTLLPPPWKTWWAYSFYVMVLATILALIIYLQVKKLQERRQLKLALWGSGDELWDVDLSAGMVSRQNQLGYLRREINESWLLKGPDNNIHPDDHYILSDAIDKQMRSQQGYVDVTYRAKTSKGDWVWLQDRGMVTMRNSLGEPVRVTGTTKNIQRLKLTEAELMSLNKDLEDRVKRRTSELQQTNEYLQKTQAQLVESEKMASLGTVVVGVSHELNTPVGNAITALSSLEHRIEKLFEQVDAGKLSKSYLYNFRESAQDSTELTRSSLGKVVDIIQSFKKISVAQNPTELTSASLNELIEFAASDYPSSDGQTSSIQDRKESVSISCDPSLQLQTHPDTLVNILRQLIENAWQHATSSGDDLRIHIDAEQQGNNIHITVKDNGKGMDEEETAQIFDPFFTTDRGARIGLGMFVVYNQINHLLNGKISCESRPGDGTCFTVILPKGTL